MTDSRGTKPQRWNISRGFLAQRAQSLWHGLILLVPAWEGGGSPLNVITGAEATITGTQSWEQGLQGLVLRGSDIVTNDGGWAFPNPGLPTAGATILVHKKKLDATNRGSSAFGVISATASHRIGVHLPWSDGTCYWDFGGQSSPTSRLIVAGLTFGDDWWVCSAGERGMELWQNGYLRGSHTSHVDRVETGLSFHLGNGNTPTTLDTDSADYSMLAVWDHQLSVPAIVELMRDPYQLIRYESVTARSFASATISGSAPGSSEAVIVAGGSTVVITLTGDTWVASGATFNAERQNIINGLDSAQSEAAGWNAEVRDKEVVGAVVRTSDTVVTITLSASPAYNITATETITVTVPASALSGGVALTGTPTFGVTAAGSGHGQLLLTGVG